jgi:putative ABC transport system permease protein
MIRHLFKLIWNRKGENMLMMIQIFFAFLVLCALTTQSFYYYNYWRMPLGFNYENVWVIYSNTNEDFKLNAENTARLETLFRELKTFSEVEAVAASQLMPFDFSNWNSRDSGIGRSLIVERNMVTDDFIQVLKLEVVQGKWYDKSDDALSYSPVVINERLAKAYFGDENPIGKPIFPRYIDDPKRGRKAAADNNEPYREERVIGVVKEFKKIGELEPPEFFAFRRSSLSDTINSGILSNLMVRVKPSAMTGAFEEKMIKKLESLEPKWTFKAETLERIRSRRIKLTLTPLTSFGIVGLFLILMIALGLIGVVWQNVTRRTREIGLRRAIGSTAQRIYVQVLGELLVIATLAVGVGVIVFLQFPLLGIIEGIEFAVYLQGLGAALVIIYSIATLCALYPSRLATKVAPVEALRYE